MGMFSWLTQDTNRSIANKYCSRPTFRVFMVNPLTDEAYEETDYEGYGEFGGKDYYELLAEINGKSSDRNVGIDLEFDTPVNKRIIYPVLVEHLENAKMYYGQEPKNCPFQGYFY